MIRQFVRVVRKIPEAKRTDNEKLVFRFAEVLTRAVVHTMHQHETLPEEVDPEDLEAFAVTRLHDYSIGAGWKKGEKLTLDSDDALLMRVLLCDIADEVKRTAPYTSFCIDGQDYYYRETDTDLSLESIAEDCQEFRSGAYYTIPEPTDAEDDIEAAYEEAATRDIYEHYPLMAKHYLDGKSVRELADEYGKSRMTIHRRIEKQTRQWSDDRDERELFGERIESFETALAHMRARQELVRFITGNGVVVSDDDSLNDLKEAARNLMRRKGR